MKIIQILILIFIISWSANSLAEADRNHKNTFSISGFDSVSEAVDSIKTILQEQGMEIVAVIDHAANAKSVDLELAPTQLILFRDRQLEKGLLNRSSTVAIELPMKFLVYETQDGTIQLIYNPSGYLSDRHTIQTRDRLISQLNKRLAQFTQLENGLITIDSHFSINETVNNLKTILLENGFFIPFTFDFKISPSNAHSDQAQLIIFGNPRIGTLLMQNQQSIGLDLPQKFLVWDDKEGEVHITYNDPVFLGKRHNLQGLDLMLSNIAVTLLQLAKEGAGNEDDSQLNTTLRPPYPPAGPVPIPYPNISILHATKDAE